MSIKINIDKAKDIAHDIRRTMRAEEFAPLDRKVTIPTEAKAAEAERQVVREKYDAMQKEINAAQSIEELKAIIP